MFSERTLETIRERMSLVELVGEYVQLKKTGQGFAGLCPFHSEKTPSFHVHPAKQIFHCFGCHKGGNVFSFLSAMEGLSFPETVQRLAKRTGVELEQENQRRETPRPNETPEAKRLLAANEWAAKYFNYLLTEVKEHRYALDYVKSRGLSDETIKKFRMGVSPKGWNTLMNLMLKRNFTLRELFQAGLVIEKENSPSQGYDRFRERLMFPIHDKEGNVIGFGARLLKDEENQPKYLNSPESPLFSKRRTLYGLHENQRGIRLRAEALVVEGYMDVVGLYDKGVQNAVATMGTALTEDHCHEIKSLTRRVVTVFDPDAAGSDASKRSVHLFLEAGIFAKDLTLPDGKDPDEYVVANGADAFYKLCEKAPRQVTKVLKEIAGRGTRSEEENSRILNDLTPILVASRRLADRAHLWDDISLLLQISPAALKEIAENNRFGPVQEAPKKAPSANSIVLTRKTNQKPRKAFPLDWDFLAACIEQPEAFLRLSKEVWMGGLQDTKVKKWLTSLGDSKSPEQFKEKLAGLLDTETDPEFLTVASAGIFDKPETTPAPAVPFQALVDSVTQKKKQLEIQALSAQVKLTQRLGDDLEGLRLLEKLKQLRSS